MRMEGSVYDGFEDAWSFRYPYHGTLRQREISRGKAAKLRSEVRKAREGNTVTICTCTSI